MEPIGLAASVLALTQSYWEDCQIHRKSQPRPTSLIGYCTESINISVLDAQRFLDKYDTENSDTLGRVRQFFHLKKKSQMAYREDDVKGLMDRVVTAKSSLKMAMSIILLQKTHHGFVSTSE
jgi:hypothetical protein